MARPPKAEEKKELTVEELVETATTPELPKVGERVALSSVKISDREFIIMKLVYDFDTGELKSLNKVAVCSSQNEAFNAFKVEAFKERMV